MTAVTEIRESVQFEGAAAVAALHVLAVLLNASTDQRADHLLTDEQRVIRYTGEVLAATTRRLERQHGLTVVAVPAPVSDYIVRLNAAIDRIDWYELRENGVVRGVK